MYRLAQNPCSGKYRHLVQEIVSRNLSELITYVFGNLNDEGFFSDEERCRKFLKRTFYLSGLVGKTIELSGMVLSWENIIMSRFADMYKKITDTRMEYTFDEFGEGLISEILLFYRNAEDDYLEEYPENAKYLVDGQMAFSVYCTEQVSDDEYDGLCKNLMSVGRKHFENLIEDCDNDLEAVLDSRYEEEYATAYKELWLQMILEVEQYGLDEPDTFEEIVEDLPESLKYAFYLDDFIFWDTDYVFVLGALEDPDVAKQRFEFLSSEIDFQVNSLEKLVFLPIDSCFEIEK
ncbi:MAG: hypothetical protein J6M92_06440 [Oribacterium sp.]|nr:hypothetical protein [Oribacterium sp.]